MRRILLVAVCLPLLAPCAFGGRKPVAKILIPSIAKYNEAIGAGCSGIGEPGGAEISGGILGWLFMLPSLRQADPSRPMTAILIEPENEYDLPDRAAVIPLKPIGGAIALRDDLKKQYGIVTGKNAIVCSAARDGSEEELHLFISDKDGIALAANSRGALVWLARRYRDGNVPAPGEVRASFPVSVEIDSSLASKILEKILPPDGEEASSAVKALSLAKDFISSTDRLCLSIMPNVRFWRLAAMAKFKGGNLAKVAAAPLYDERNLNLIPSSCLGKSSGDVPLAVSVLPLSFRAIFGRNPHIVNFTPFHILPNLPSLDSELYGQMTGDRSSGYVFDVHSRQAGKLTAYRLKNANKTEEILKNNLGAGARDTSELSYNDPRMAGDATIYGYKTAASSHRSIGKAEFALQSVSVAFSMTQTEVAVKDGILFVAYGERGLLDSWLGGKITDLRDLRLEEVTTQLGEVPPDEELLGGGEFAPSQLLEKIVSCLPELAPVKRLIPRPGSGANWRLLRRGEELVWDVSVSSSEILAAKTISRLDLEFLNQFLLMKSFSAGEGAE